MTISGLRTYILLKTIMTIANSSGEGQAGQELGEKR
jgi:hypothetical protein